METYKEEKIKTECLYVRFALQSGENWHKKKETYIDERMDSGITKGICRLILAGVLMLKNFK